MATFAPVLILDGLASIAATNRTLISVTNIPKWTDTLASRMIQEISKKAGVEANDYGSLSRSLGQPPGPTQRKVFADGSANAGPQSARLCVLAESTMERGVVTAYGWLTRRPIKAFAPADLDNACQWVLGEIPNLSAAAIDLRRAVLECHKLLGSDLMKTVPTRSQRSV